MKILITGAGGFIGSNTVDYLLERKHFLVAVDDFSTGNVKNLIRFRGDRIEIVDIRETGGMDSVFSEYLHDVILHLAAQSAITTAWNNPRRDLDVNGMGTLNLIELAIKYRVKKFVFSSTAAVYGHKGGYFASKETDKCQPDTPYGISKLAAEHYIRLMFPNHVILRYANIYGPRQVPIGENQVIARAFRHFIHGDNFAVVGDGNQKRDFVYVADVCHANYMALIENQTGTFNVASGKSHSVNEVLREIEKVYAVPGYQWAHTSEPDARGSVWMNGSLIRNKLGWKSSTSLAQGIKLTAKAWEGK